MADKTRTDKSSKELPQQSIQDQLNRIGQSFSEQHLIRFDWRVLSLIALTLLAFCFNVMVKSNGSSMQHWNRFTRADSAKQTHIGSPRFIRFDEWCMATPLTLSQVKHGFPAANAATGAGTSPLLMTLPVKTFPSVLRPSLWAYFIFDTETAYSFVWNYKTFGMFIGVFFLLMLLSANNFWLSLSGSVWMLYSSFTQWWFSTPEPEMIMSVSLVFVFFIYLISSQKPITILLSALGLAVFSVAFALFFYPPHQIPLAYMMLFILVAYMMSSFKKEHFKSYAIIRVVGVVGVLALIGFCMSSFLAQARDTIALVTNTVYPGNRISTGGDVSLERYFAGFIDMFFSEHSYPIGWENVCEASNFILLWPVVLFAMLHDKQSSGKLMLWMILAYILFMSIWILVGYPSFLASITLLSRVKENRAFIGVGFASVVMVVLWLSRGASEQGDVHSETENSDTKKKRKKGDSELRTASSLMSSLQLGSRNTIVSAVVAVLVIVYASMVHGSSPDVLGAGQNLLAGLIAGILTQLILVRQRFLFGVFIMSLTILSNFLTNPWLLGMGPVNDSDLMHTLSEIRRTDPDARWVSYGSNIIANYYLAAGVNIINGTKFAPDLALMGQLDSQHRYDTLINRFAHIQFKTLDKARSDSDYVMEPNNYDGYKVMINPGAPQLERMKVKYFAFAGLPPQEVISKLEPMFDNAICGQWLYRRREADATQREEAPYKVMRYDADSTRFFIGKVEMSPNREHNAFVITGVSYDKATNDLCGGVCAEVNGRIIEGTYGLPNPDAKVEQYRNTAFRLDLPFSRLGTGHIEFKLRFVSRDKKVYSTSNERFGVDIDPVAEPPVEAELRH